MANFFPWPTNGVHRVGSGRGALGPEGYNYNPHPKVRAAIAAYVDPDERFVGSYDSQLTTTDGGKDLRLARILVSYRRLVVYLVKGTFKEKYIVYTIPYDSVKSAVIRKTRDLMGTSYYTVSIKTRDRDGWVFGFTNKKEVDEFSDAVEGMLLMYRSLD